jgi:sugar phosphate isomerase/epimerase
MRRSIRATAHIGCKYWVIHPLFPFGDCGFDMESFWRINEEFFKELVPYAKQYGVIVCFENMPMKTVSMSTTEKSLEFIHRINMDNMMLCLDTGHEAVFGLSPADAVRRAGKELAVLHVHDNDGNRDLHRMPGMGVIDFKDFCKALREIEFDGVFSLELDGDLDGFFPGLSTDARLSMIRAVIHSILEE